MYTLFIPLKSDKLVKFSRFPSVSLKPCNGAELMFHDNLLAANLGGVIEQYVGQEILAAIDWYEERNIYFWARDAKSSNAEVDYLVTS